jgi:Putative transposase
MDHFHLHSIFTARALSVDRKKSIGTRRKYLIRVQSLAKEFKKRYLDKQWIIYTKQPFGEPEQVFEYLGGDTRRVAITINRIIAIDDGKVRFSYRDRSDDNKLKDLLSALKSLSGGFSSTCCREVLPKSIITGS